MSLQTLNATINLALQSSRFRFVLAALKGLRNGAVYGARIRAPHALVMVFLFGQGSMVDKLLTIMRLTKLHATNLAKFVFGYKLLSGGLGVWQMQRRQWHSFVAACCVGYFVFGENNVVNMQIMLYLVSRILLGFSRLSTESGSFIPTPSFPIFPLFASVICGLQMWLFEHHQSVLQKSLQTSMTHLYRDSENWTDLWDFVLSKGGKTTAPNPRSSA